MRMTSRIAIAWLAIGFMMQLHHASVHADKFIMKTGETYVGHYEREGVIAGAFDGVKRTLFRSTRMARQEPGAGSGGWESFKLIQPRKTNFTSNQMPTVLAGISAGPWDEFGRRKFSYQPPRNTAKTIELTQALVELGPKAVKFRGVETYWTGQLATSNIPRPVIVGLLNRIPKEEKDERLRVVRYYLQAGWFEEALAAVKALRKDFPDMSEVLNTAETGILDAELNDNLEEWKKLLAVGAPADEIQAALEKAMKSSLGGSQTVRTAAQEFLDQLNATQNARARRQRELKSAFDGTKSGSATAGPGPNHLADMLEALTRCPVLVEPIFAAFDKYARNPDGVDPKKAWSLALSAWCAGTQLVTEDIAIALAFADAHEAISKAAQSSTAVERQSLASRLGALQIPAKEGDRPLSAIEAEAITQRIRPANTLSDNPQKRTITYRVENDLNATPSEYIATVPPGYSRFGQWPAVVVLNPGGNPASALEPWSKEAARRGYILIAPDLKDTGAYHHSTDEHATVTLSLRDALKRLAINPDRVFVAGGLGGGDMAWDYATAHPDSLAGGVVLSGLPAKYVPAYRTNTQMVPLYIVEGDLAPGEPQIILPMAKGLMQKNWDATYVQYSKRGYEFFQEEIPFAMDWMNGRQRNPAPNEFTAVAGREGDQRFFGLVIQEFSAGRSKTPETVDPLGENLKPSSISAKYSAVANQIQLTSDGVKSMDVWLSPRQFDFTKRVDVKLGGRSRFKGMPAIQWPEFLDDLAARCDTRQTYFMKVEIR